MGKPLRCAKCVVLIATTFGLQVAHDLSCLSTLNNDLGYIIDLYVTLPLQFVLQYSTVQGKHLM